MDKTEDSYHPIYRNDPKELYNKLHCLVTITMKNEEKHDGFVYTIDPVSGR